MHSSTRENYCASQENSTFQENYLSPTWDEGRVDQGTRPVVLWKKVSFSPKTKQTLAIVACGMNDKAARSCTGNVIAAGNDRVPLTHKNSVKRCRLSALPHTKGRGLAPPTCKSMTIFMRSCHRNDFGRHISKWPRHATAVLKRPCHQKSCARCARSCALLITVEQILSGPAVALFVAVSPLSKGLNGKSVDLKFLHTLAAKLEYGIYHFAFL